MPTGKDIKGLLKSQKLAAHKKLGQNFLVHPHTAQKIADLASISPTDSVIELGVGFGALTFPLAERARKVIGIEIDAGIVRWHEEHKELPDNVHLIHQDLLKSDFRKLADETKEPLKILANLPYSISNPLLFKLIDNKEVIDWAVLMLQKEVGERLTAAVGTKDYGVLTVLLNAYATVETLMELGPGQFHPRPKVDSVVVRITFNPVPARVTNLPPFDRQLFKKIVKSAFQKRRKTLLNALSTNALLPYEKKSVRKALDRAGIDHKIRAERLSTEDYVMLTNAFSELD